MNTQKCAPKPVIFLFLVCCLVDFFFVPGFSFFSYSCLIFFCIWGLHVCVSVSFFFPSFHILSRLLVFFFSFFFGSFNSNFFHFFLLSIHNDKNKYTNWNPHTYRETKTQTNTLELCSFPFFIHFRFCDFGWLCLIRAFFLFNQIF